MGNADFEPLGEHCACVALNVHTPLINLLHRIAAKGMDDLHGDFRQVVGMRKSNFHISFESYVEYDDQRIC